MQVDKIPYGVMLILGLVGGIGLLLVKVDNRSADVATRIVPWARLYRRKWFRLCAAFICFGLALPSLVFLAGWLD
jgi:hypothetical protein